MTTKAQAYNRAIAKALGWTDIRVAQYHDGEWDIFGIPPGADDERPLPDYYTDLKAAISAAGELLPENHRIEVVIFPSHIAVVYYGDETYNCRHEKVARSTEEAPAAICEAIVQARGLVVDESSAHDSTQNILESEGE